MPDRPEICTLRVRNCHIWGYIPPSGGNMNEHSAPLPPVRARGAESIFKCIITYIVL